MVTDVASNGQEVIRSVRKNKPDVILMDIRMPKLDGVQCTKIIKGKLSSDKNSLFSPRLTMTSTFTML